MMAKEFFQNFGTNFDIYQLQIWVRAKDVPEPRPKDDVYINGEKWYVDHVSNFDGTMYCLEIVHNVRAVRP